MKSLILLGAFCIVATTMHADASAQRPKQHLMKHGMSTKGDVWAQSYAACRPWHGQHYYLQYGQPTSLIVPPTASMQTNYSWGVSQNTMTPIYHQYGAAAMPSAGGAFYGTPRWPTHTRQFGVYPVRSPW